MKQWVRVMNSYELAEEYVENSTEDSEATSRSRQF